jgi:tetratricopeptide (TPR) repeat protein
MHGRTIGYSGLPIARAWKLGLVLLSAALTGYFSAGPVMAQQPQPQQQQQQQQLTAQMLIGDAVSEAGAKYPDVDEAIKRFSNRDFLGARTFLEGAKRKDNSLPPTDLIMAKLHFLAGDEAAGRNALEATVSTSPNDPEVFLILAKSALQQVRTVEAEALYDKALTLTEKFSENPKRKRNFEISARTGRAAVAERRRNWAAAAADLRALLKVDPDNASAHYRLGAALFMQAKTPQEFKAGYDEFVAAKKLDKDKAIPNPYVSAALWYDQLDKKAEARTAFDRAVAEDKANPATMASYAEWLIRSGSVDKAEAALADARKANPSSLQVLILSGVAARMAKKMKPAEDYFLQALSVSPSNGAVLNQLALLLADQMDKEKQDRALQFALINSKINPQNSEAQITLSWVLYQLGRLTEANAAFAEGFRLGMGNLSPDSSFLVAKMLVDQNRTDTAKTILSNALENDSQGIFVNKQDAQALLASLDNKK